VELLAGIDAVRKYLADSGRRVTPENRGLSIAFPAGGKPRRLDFVWERVPGVVTLFVTLGEQRIPAARRVEIGGRLTELDTKLSAPGFYLGESCVVYQTLLVLNHDGSVSAHALETILAAAAAELDRHVPAVMEILGG